MSSQDVCSLFHSQRSGVTQAKTTYQIKNECSNPRRSELKSQRKRERPNEFFIPRRSELKSRNNILSP